MARLEQAVHLDPHTGSADNGLCFHCSHSSATPGSDRGYVSIAYLPPGSETAVSWITVRYLLCFVDESNELRAESFQLMTARPLEHVR